MYQEEIKTQEEALTHLYFHCCFRDGKFTDEEIKAVSGKLVAIGLNKELNFKDEIVKYKSYRNGIDDERQYLCYLMQILMPVNNLALFSYCIELCLSDEKLGATEEALLSKIGDVLEIDETEQAITKKLLVQRKIVETQGLL